MCLPSRHTRLLISQRQHDPREVGLVGEKAKPVYGIILAYYIFGDQEMLATNSFFGVFLIVLSIILSISVEESDHPSIEVV